MADKEIWKALATDVTDEERAVRRAAFHTLLAGEPTDRSHLVSVTGLDPLKVNALLDGLARRGLIVVEPDSGLVVGSCGLSTVPTDHRLRIRGRELFTWCAEDAVGIPAALNEDASVSSSCRVCAVGVNIDMVGGLVDHAEPSDARVWVMPFEAGRSVVGYT
jgi:alkylmercury lyase